MNNVTTFHAFSCFEVPKVKQTSEKSATYLGFFEVSAILSDHSSQRKPGELIVFR